MKKTLSFLLFIISCSTIIGQNLRQFEENGKYGYKDKESGEIVVPAKYDDVYYYFNPEDKLARVKLNGKYGYIDKTGKEIIELKYDDGAFVFTKDCVFEVSINGKWGLIDCEGNQIVSHKYDYLYHFGDHIFDEIRSRNDLFIAKNGKLSSVIDKTGKEILPFKYDVVLEYYNVPFLVSLNNKWGLVDLNNNEVLPIKYNGYFPHNSLKGNGYEPLRQNDKWGHIDSNGKIVIPFQYEQTYQFAGGLAAIQKDGKYGYIDKTNKVVISPKYDAILYSNSFEFGPAPLNIGAVIKSNSVKDGYNPEGGKWGFVNKSGKEITEFKYDEVKNFKNGFAQVKLKDKWGLIDTNGKEVLPIIYDEIKGTRSWGNGKTIIANIRIVDTNGKIGYVDENTNELLVPCKYDKIDQYNNEILKVKINNKFGYFNINMKKEIISTKYDEAGHFYGDSKTALVKLNGREFKIDRNGNEMKD